MRKERECVEAMARSLAMYHAVMAQEAVRLLGEEEGRLFVEKVVARFGFERGRNIREKVLANGEALTLANMNGSYDLPLAYAWISEKFDDGSDITYCPMHEQWKAMGELELGKLYCAVDAALANGFSQSLQFSRHSTLMDGECCCRHRYTTEPEGKE